MTTLTIILTITATAHLTSGLVSLILTALYDHMVTGCNMKRYLSINSLIWILSGGYGFANMVHAFQYDEYNAPKTANLIDLF